METRRVRPLPALRLRGGGGNDRIPGQDEEVEYASGQNQRRVRTIKFNDAPGREPPFWVCEDCGNMLLPKEDRTTQKLMRFCRNCNQQTDADNNLVYVNDLRPRSRMTDAGSDVTKDPTLPRAMNTNCASCQYTESVFFQAPMKGDEGMKLIFMCLRCAPRPCRPAAHSPTPRVRAGVGVAGLRPREAGKWGAEAEASTARLPLARAHPPSAPRRAQVQLPLAAIDESLPAREGGFQACRRRFPCFLRGGRRSALERVLGAAFRRAAFRRAPRCARAAARAAALPYHRKTWACNLFRV
eukprot:5721758-Prymnesium_polylepis.2